MSEGELVMSRKERQRMVVMGRVGTRAITLAEASQLMDLSYRHSKRVWKRWRADGEWGLVHRSRGRESNRRLDAEFREAVLAAYRARYDDFGPTLASEKLEENEGLEVDHETLRRWLIGEQLWQGRRRWRKHRRRRERRAHFGELVQMDGSHHEWFEERGPQCCLMSMVDDATGQTLALMSAEETSEVAMLLLKEWIETHGVPRALYTDRKNVFVADRDQTPEEKRAGLEPMTAFGLACHRLQIEIIRAHSPQAKGRVERKHGVFQDRWVKDLRLEGISDVESANESLPEFTRSLNRRFAIEPREAADYHRPLDPHTRLEDVLCFEEKRTLGRDWTVRYQNRFFQILAERGRPAPGSRIAVRRRLDGSLLMLHGERRLKFVELPTPPPRPSTKPKAALAQPSRPWRPAPDHPWRRPFKPKRAKEALEASAIRGSQVAARRGGEPVEMTSCDQPVHADASARPALLDTVRRDTGCSQDLENSPGSLEADAPGKTASFPQFHSPATSRSFFEKSQKKPKGENKSKQPSPPKRGHFYRVKQGDISKES